MTWLILAGRGFGKTRSGAEWVRALIESGQYGRIAIVAEDAGDAREVMIEGESGLLNVCPPWNKPIYEPSKKRVTWQNGARASIYSADDPESLRGPQHDAAWLDELCKWRYQQDTWDQVQFGLRLGKRPIQCVTTTPRPTKLLKEIIQLKATRVTKGSTYDNLDNLAPIFREAIVGRYEGTRLGQQELYAKILDDNPNALFHQQLIDQHRVKEIPDTIRRIAVAVDPPASGNAKSDECGIVVAAKTDGNRPHYYVLRDATVQGRSPEGWAKAAVLQYHMQKADVLVIEANQGGDMAEAVVKQVDPDVKVVQVHASRGKWARAEPVAGLYEQGRVHHVGMMSTLEDQMCDFDNTGTVEGDSPDRLDALVWAISELSGNRLAEPRIRSL